MTDFASMIRALGTSDLELDRISDVHFGDLKEEAQPGDHLMVKMPGDPIWHEGIYYDRKRVIDNMPGSGVNKRKLTAFAPTGHERLIIVKYKLDSEAELARSLQRALALWQFCKANPHDFHSQYDVLLNNCQHFACFCRTGRRESWQLKAVAEATLHVIEAAMKGSQAKAHKLSVEALEEL